jgi:hypothetical protein
LGTCPVDGHALGVGTNHDAEERVRAALGTEEPGLLRRLSFDTEAGAVTIQGREEADLRAAAAINRLAAAR